MLTLFWSYSWMSMSDLLNRPYSGSSIHIGLNRDTYSVLHFKKIPKSFNQPITKWFPLCNRVKSIMLLCGLFYQVTKCICSLLFTHEENKTITWEKAKFKVKSWVNIAIGSLRMHNSASFSGLSFLFSF